MRSYLPLSVLLASQILLAAATHRPLHCQSPAQADALMLLHQLDSVRVDSTRSLDTAAITVLLGLIESVVADEPDSGFRATVSEGYIRFGERLIQQRVTFTLATRVLARALRHNPDTMGVSRPQLLLGVAGTFQVMEELASRPVDGSCDGRQELVAQAAGAQTALEAGRAASPLVADAMLEQLGVVIEQHRACWLRGGGR